MVNLDAGYHKIEVWYLQALQSSSLVLSWRANPTLNFFPIPTKLLFKSVQLEKFIEEEAVKADKIDRIDIAKEQTLPVSEAVSIETAD